VKKLVSFDFDKTMCFTPEPEEGKIIFKNKTGLDWPYRGWWGRAETLNLEIFPIPVNQYVYREYLNYLDDPNSYVILATGRLSKLRDEVISVLDHHDLKFDELHLNPGMDTYIFKRDLFEKLIFRNKPDLFVMYDDRGEHLSKFEDWAKTQPCEIHIIDVIKKTTKIFNN
jgi:hypothetical protein